MASTNIQDLEVVLPRIMPAPKPDGGFRIVHQLDPLNVLAYTAMTFEVANAIEAARPPVEDRISCSYRINIDPAQGRFFGANNGYRDFVEQSRALAANHEYVFLADITDFYNQIYLHRLQNAISSAGPNLGAIASDIERFLTRLNDGVSHGIPVGPTASVIMAEAVLLDVDAFITGRGYRHTRYVDDFRIFGDDQSSLNNLHQELTKYLHSHHRLVFVSGKTRTLGSAEFLDSILDDPEEVERREIHDALTMVRPLNRYAIGEDTEDGGVDAAEQRAEVLEGLMDRVCAIEPLDLGLARHVLRRCRRYGIRAIVQQLLDRLEHFAPVMNDVVIYLSEVMNRAFVDRYQAQLEGVLALPGVLGIEWARYWMAELIVRNSSLLDRPVCRQFVAEHGDLEHQAQAALARRDVAWVRDQKPHIDELGGWPRRQVLRSGLALAADERRYWYRNIQANNRPGVERWFLPWLISQH
jgi:hypothetical protein